MNNTNSTLYQHASYDRINWNIPGYYYQHPDSYYYQYFWQDYDLSYAHKDIAGSIYVIVSAIQFLLYARILTVNV